MIQKGDKIAWFEEGGRGSGILQGEVERVYKKKFKIRDEYYNFSLDKENKTLIKYYEYHEVSGITFALNEDRGKFISDIEKGKRIKSIGQELDRVDKSIKDNEKWICTYKEMIEKAEFDLEFDHKTKEVLKNKLKREEL